MRSNRTKGGSFPSIRLTGERICSTVVAKGHSGVHTTTIRAVKLRRATDYSVLGQSRGLFFNQLDNGVCEVAAKLDGPSSSHEAAGVGQNGYGTVVAWVHGYSGIAKATTTSRAT